MEKRLLAEQLAERLAYAKQHLPEITTAYDRFVAHLETSGMSDNAVQEGDEMPAFGLFDANGHFVTSDDLLRHGPLVVSFYRGIWCPYCRTEISALRDAYPDIQAKGARLVLVSGEVGGRGSLAVREFDLPFEVLCDVDLGVALMFGLVFRVPDDIIAQYMKMGIDLVTFHGNPNWFLPVPATYVVSVDGIVRSAFIDPEFRRRMDPVDILAALERINSRVG